MRLECEHLYSFTHSLEFQMHVPRAQNNHLHPIVERNFHNTLINPTQMRLKMRSCFPDILSWPNLRKKCMEAILGCAQCKKDWFEAKLFYFFSRRNAITSMLSHFHWHGKRIMKNKRWSESSFPILNSSTICFAFTLEIADWVGWPSMDFWWEEGVHWVCVLWCESMDSSTLCDELD